MSGAQFLLNALGVDALDADRHVLAGGEHLVELARVRVGRDIEGEVDELVRAVAHGRHMPDPLRIGDGRPNFCMTRM